MGFGSCWIRPDGRVIKVGKRSHEDISGEFGLTQEQALKEGWIRITGTSDKKIHVEIGDARDENAVELLEQYLFEKWYPRVSLGSVVELYVRKPLGGAYVYFSKLNMDEMPFKEMIEFLVKAEIVRGRSRR